MDSELKIAIDVAADAIRRAESIVATGHVGPDGDALGSMLALAIAAREAGKTAWCTFGEPFVVPTEFRFLDQEWLASPTTDFGDIDLFIACDTAAPDRLGSVAPLARSAGTVVVIDHHISNGGFGDIVVVDPTAAATAQLVYYVIEALGWELTPSVATALYAGMVTDTGRFQYSSTTPEVHRITASLLEAGVEPDVVGQHLYEETPFGYLHVAGAVLSRARLDVDRSLVWSILEREDLEAAGIGVEATDGLIDLIRVSEEADVACLLKRLEPGVTKGSLRSRGRVDVAAIAAELGGGGHHNAAGFTHAAQPEEVVDFILSRL